MKGLLALGGALAAALLGLPVLAVLVSASQAGGACSARRRRGVDALVRRDPGSPPPTDRRGAASRGTESRRRA